MGVISDWQGEQFEREFFNAIDKELVRSSNILRRGLSDVLATTGKSPPPSPKGSDIPFNRTGTLARSWHSVTKSKRTPTRYIAGVHTKVGYALDLVIRGGAGRRNYMNSSLYWYQRTLSLIKKRLDPKRLVKVASKGIFPT